MDKQELEFRVNQIVYEKVFDDEECKTIESYYTDLVSAHTLAYNQNPKDKFSENYRKSLTRGLYEEESLWIKSKVLASMKSINDKYFQLDSLSFEQFSILQYGVNDEFKWHTDVGLETPYSLRRISIVIFISDRDKYAGGDLEFMPKLKEPLEMKRGYMIAFPSHKVHRVSPIISGTRRTLVSWLYEYRT